MTCQLGTRGGLFPVEWLQSCVRDALQGHLNVDIGDGCETMPAIDLFFATREQSDMCIKYVDIARASKLWRWTVHKGYVMVAPGPDNPIRKDWPMKSHSRGQEIIGAVYFHQWVAKSFSRTLGHVQENFDVEKKYNYKLKLLCCHMCGHSRCMRPAHICLQTAHQDRLDTEHHKANRGSIRPIDSSRYHM